MASIMPQTPAGAFPALYTPWQEAPTTWYPNERPQAPTPSMRLDGAVACAKRLASKYGGGNTEAPVGECAVL